jgi:hypothetical protein
VDIKMSRLLFTNAAEVRWQGHDRCARRVDMRAEYGAIPSRAGSNAGAAISERA